ncbi:uncharacterized protein LOC120288403 isoform X6 [Eucalyptus grandis]|uniref:uncharacterized protein LOC120288403 isoform X6 n=1 Tax=Eucalyptus grandis TaxID=71139 RepID=UPI00192E7818|nr:uncharacterized protein LOC120288403 isoform X6 [Eucalyptus grandis]
MEQEIQIIQLLITLNQSEPVQVMLHNLTSILVSVKRRPKTWQLMGEVLLLLVGILVLTRTGQKQREQRLLLMCNLQKVRVRESLHQALEGLRENIYWRLNYKVEKGNVLFASLIQKLSLVICPRI